MWAKVVFLIIAAKAGAALGCCWGRTTGDIFGEAGARGEMVGLGCLSGELVVVARW